jgi:O-antigen ligase
MPRFSLFLIILAFIQYFNIVGLGKIIGSLYAPVYHVDAMLSGSKRILLTGSDPNVGAAIVMLFFLYNLFLSVYKKKVTAIIRTALLIVVILMTSSRTSFLALIFILVFFLLISDSVKVSFKIAIIIIFMVVIISLYNYFQYIAIGLSSLLSGKNTSLLARFMKWETALDLFRQSPIIGWGPGKGLMETVVDGEYVLLLRRYGVVGTLVILINVLCMPFWRKNVISRKNMQKYNKIKIIDSTLKYYVIEIIFVMITNNFFSGYQLLLPFVFLCIVSYKENNRK